MWLLSFFCPVYVQAKSIFQLMYPEEEFFPQPVPQPLVEEEEPPQQQQGREEGEELAQEVDKDERDDAEGGDNAAQAAEETISAAEASNWDVFCVWFIGFCGIIVDGPMWLLIM